MAKKKIDFRDPIVERVVDKFVSRSDVGYEKYGNTLHDERTKKMKGLFKYLNDVQEELMDAILYIQACKEEIQDLSEEALIQEFKEPEIPEHKGHHYAFTIDEDRMDIIGQNGNDGLHYEENQEKYWHGNSTIQYDKFTFSIK
jgi:hypothetical protein